MSAKTPTEFVIDDHAFRVERLKVKDSLKGLRLVGKVLLPAMAEAYGAPDGQIGDAISKAVSGLDCLPELLDLFAPNTKFTNGQVTSPTALSAFVDDVFQGHPDWVVQYLIEATKGEYGSFLSGTGPLAVMWRQATSPTASGSPKS